MSSVHSVHNQNSLLAALPLDVLDRLQPWLERVPLPLGRAIGEFGQGHDYVYFPTTAIVSLVHVVQDGASSEVAIVGFDGVVGMSPFMVGKNPNLRAMVRTAGEGYRVSTKHLKAEFDKGGALQFLLLRAAQKLFIQMTQTAACNRHHSIHQQLCRWLLLTHDRLRCNEISMTQESISNLLGVRREGVTKAAWDLQRSGLIHYRRGKITLLDREGLEARSCECYGVVSRETERLHAMFPDPHATVEAILTQALSKPAKSLRVLVVDEDTHAGGNVADFFNWRGHDTRAFETAHEAIQFAPQFSPELVLRDLDIPDIYGTEVSTQLRGTGGDAPVPLIAGLSASKSHYLRSRCAEVGFDCYVTKPVSINEYDYLLSAADRRSQRDETFNKLKRDHDVASYEFVVAQLTFGGLILDFSKNRSDTQGALRRLERVRRIIDLTNSWLERAARLSSEQVNRISTMTAALSRRLDEK